MKTVTKTISELVDTDESPLPLHVIANSMGINLVSVDSVTWSRQDDGQLTGLAIIFNPDPKEESE